MRRLMQRLKLLKLLITQRLFDMKMHLYILAAALLTLSACQPGSSPNRTDGIKDALDARPNEKLRDAGEDIGEAAKDVGRDIKDVVNDK
jgi:hypothetical protein